MPGFKWEKFFSKQGFKNIAGVDEAGRGPLAGPVVAAAVILPRGIKIKGLDDSKKLSPKKRKDLYEIICKKAIAVSSCIVSEKIIDKINILQATFKAMKEAVESLDIKADLVLVDGKLEGTFLIPQKCIIKGDSISSSIAAASIIAKVVRDKIMENYAKKFPKYCFEKHKGYGTKLHLKKISQYGICGIHRQSFKIRETSSKTKNPLDLERTPLLNFTPRR